MHKSSWVVAAVLMTACSSSESSSGTASSSGTTSSSSSTSGSTDGCDVTANTTATATVATSGCAVLSRDTSSCEAARTALGLTGVWLKFSCRVTLAVAGGQVTAKIDGQPDYKSSYYATTSACYEAYTGAIRNPNSISALDLTLSVAQTPSTTGGGAAMQGAVVGMAVNGVPIFGNFAAPGDDIFQEALTFDKCAGHPQDQGVYHYHAEPLALTNDDANLVGVLLDGYPVYGRKDADGTTPSDLDSAGGHTHVTSESPSAAVYHYHVNEQTSTGARTGGEKQWFITAGTFHGAKGSCSGSGC